MSIMRGSLIAFRLPPGTENRIMLKFVRGLYGQDSTSWHGKYEYHRQGLLEKMPYRKFTKGVILLREEDVTPVKLYLDQYGAKYYIATVELRTEDEIF
ncbi:MAG: hypothetical protein M1344_02490 [Candidatus Thermoplasmatota archaeon]|jgi:hypothetical protein|nr:hypothetical protein [Candidatus Thermoplasmatota archaeon]